MTKIPKISKGEFGYEGTIELQTWGNFQIKNDIYSLGNSTENSDGTYRIDIGGDMVDENPKIIDSHIKAYNYLIVNQDEIKENILKVLMSEYQDLQESYGYDNEEKLEYMPDVSNISEFKNLIELSTIHLMNIEKDGIAYVGYQFGCTWDDEHGMGVMTHKKRIIDFGGADSSFLTWIAEEDLSKVDKQ